MAKSKVDKTKAHYRLVHFYKREHESAAPTLAAALAQLEERRLNGTTECYTQLWDMRNETDGEMVGFFEDGAPATLDVLKPTTAKLIH